MPTGFLRVHRTCLGSRYRGITDRSGAVCKNQEASCAKEREVPVREIDEPF